MNAIEANGNDSDHGHSAVAVETTSERVLRVPLPSFASRIPVGPHLCEIVLVLLVSGAIFAAPGLEFRIDGLSSPSWEQCSGLFMAAAVFVCLRCPGEVVIGADGILLREVVCSLFIRYATLERIAPDARGVRLELKDGTVLLLRTHSPLLLARIQQAEALETRTARPRAPLERLDRGRRSLVVWSEDLRRLRVGVDDYRSATVSAADLGAVIADPTAPIEQRIGAAVVLGAVDREGARCHARRAAKACAGGAWPDALRCAAEGAVTLAILKLNSRAALRGSIDPPACTRKRAALATVCLS